jgi:hypothetical protein
MKEKRLLKEKRKMKRLMETRSQNATNEYSLQPRGIMGDSVKVMKVESIKPAPKK